MSVMNENDNQRLTKILTELNNEINPEILESQRRENSINDKLNTLQNKMIQKVKLKCNDVYTWFENNKNNLSVEKSNDPETQKYLKELQECTASMELGLRDEMVNAERKIELISDGHNTCTQTCVKNELKSEDIYIKRCFKNCYENTFKKTDILQNNLILKIDEVLINLNKI